MGNEISLLVAFTAGLLSFLSPCVLPLIPAYISFITGVSIKDLTDSGSKNVGTNKIILETALFCLGFSVVFILLGATITFMGGFLSAHQDKIRIGGGILIILFGLHITGLLKFKTLEKEKKIALKGKPASLLGSFVVGVVFAVGWTPCIGPILGSILALAATKESVNQGMLLLCSYSLGLAVPFFITSVAINGFLRLSRKISKYLNVISIISGAILIIVGILLVTNRFQISL